MKNTNKDSPNYVFSEDYHYLITLKPNYFQHVSSDTLGACSSLRNEVSHYYKITTQRGQLLQEA
jgi:hypothetical protein